MTGSNVLIPQRKFNSTKMHSITFEEATPGFLKHRLLLLNLSAVGVRYMSQLIARENRAITSKGGKVLPNELWAAILKLVDGEFCFVQASVVSETPAGKTLCCRRNRFGPTEAHSDAWWIGDLESLRHVLDLEEYMGSATQATAVGLFGEMVDFVPKPRPLYGPENTFHVFTRCSGRDLEPPCLYAHVTVPDVISRIGGGACHFCGGSRFVCHDHLNKDGYHLEDGGFEISYVATGCNRRTLVCPLCVGGGLFDEHRAYLNQREWSDYLSDDEADEIHEWLEAWLKERLEELGYASAYSEYESAAVKNCSDWNMPD